MPETESEIDPTVPAALQEPSIEPLAQASDYRDEYDVRVAFESAAKLLDIPSTYQIEARFYPYAGLRSTVQIDRRSRRIVGKVSDGLKAVSTEALLGLALDLTAKVFRRPMPPHVVRYVQAYRDGVGGERAFALHDSLRKSRGRKREENVQGTHVNLQEILDKVLRDYPLTLTGITKPGIHWTVHKSRHRLAFYDSAFHDVVVSRKFDRPDVPAYFLEFLVFHELLHAKHAVEHGKRNRVHHRAFKNDERKFALYGPAQAYMRRIG